jgi:hypothetical protein
MRRVLAAILALLLFVVSAFAFTSCWIGGDYTPERGGGTVATEGPPMAEGSSTTSSSDTSSTQPQAPADTSDDDDDMDVFGD